MDSMVLGLKRCGKTYLCKQLAKAWHEDDALVFVYDPMRGSDWTTPHVFGNFQEFAKVAEMNRSAYLIIDECFTLSDKEDKRVLTNLMAFGRHYGHTVIMIGQRYTAVPPTARNLCERLFVFKQSPQDAMLIYGDYPYDEVKQLPNFERGEYLDLTSFSCDRRRIF